MLERVSPDNNALATQAVVMRAVEDVVYNVVVRRSFSPITKLSGHSWVAKEVLEPGDEGNTEKDMLWVAASTIIASSFKASLAAIRAFLERLINTSVRDARVHAAMNLTTIYP
jgi:hypothetical protein